MPSTKPTYVLGLNVYAKDVSACFLRDGKIAFAISKERFTREKRAGGFYQEVIDYCVSAEGIKVEEVDVTVHNCSLLPVQDLEARLKHLDRPDLLSPRDREHALTHPHFLSSRMLKK